jgi:hypothetical protein
MKRLAMIAAIGTVAWLGLFAPVSRATELAGGLKLGLNAAFVLGADASDFPYAAGYDWIMRFGYCGGGFVALDLYPAVSIQAEALLTRKGSAQLGALFDVESYKYSLIMDYLEVPLLIKFTAPPSKKLRFFMLGGPAVAVKLGGKLKRDSETLPFSGFKSTDIGLVIGAGLLSGSHVFSELRCTMGLTKVIERDGVPLNVKNGVVSLAFGYVF